MGLDLPSGAWEETALYWLPLLPHLFSRHLPELDSLGSHCIERATKPHTAVASVLNLYMTKVRTATQCSLKQLIVGMMGLLVNPCNGYCQEVKRDRKSSIISSAVNSADQKLSTVSSDCTRLGCIGSEDFKATAVR